MSSTTADANREPKPVPGRSAHRFRSAPMVSTSEVRRGSECSFIDLGDSARLALLLTPKSRGTFAEQMAEVLKAMDHCLRTQVQPMQVTVQTVFLRTRGDRVECERLLSRHFGETRPVTNFVLQPPCCGAALAIEAWAIGGSDVKIERFGQYALAVSYDSVRWVYCAGIEVTRADQGAHHQATQGLTVLQRVLQDAGSSLEHVVRTWFYLGDITGLEGQTQRYKELNRARTDFYFNMRFGRGLIESHIPQGAYPASTGIGAGESGLVIGCLALDTSRKDVSLLPLENPQQTPAYAYHPKYSPQSPKFSRAMALVLGNYTTTWISGTASIVDSESRHTGDVERQTEQTIDNIERLIGPENFAFHGVRGGGARLTDLAKVRIYLKRPRDFARCKAVCERRFGSVPAVYAIADVCRPELLVEIEGVAFSRLPKP